MMVENRKRLKYPKHSRAERERLCRDLFRLVTELKMKQGEVAKIAKLSQATISKWMRTGRGDIDGGSVPFGRRFVDLIALNQLLREELVKRRTTQRIETWAPQQVTPIQEALNMERPIGEKYRNLSRKGSEDCIRYERQIAGVLWGARFPTTDWDEAVRMRDVFEEAFGLPVPSPTALAASRAAQARKSNGDAPQQVTLNVDHGGEQDVQPPAAFTAAIAEIVTREVLKTLGLQQKH